jgi:hypothetical protein
LTSGDDVCSVTNADFDWLTPLAIALGTMWLTAAVQSLLLPDLTVGYAQGHEVLPCLVPQMHMDRYNAARRNVLLLGALAAAGNKANSKGSKGTKQGGVSGEPMMGPRAKASRDLACRSLASLTLQKKCQFVYKLVWFEFGRSVCRTGQAEPEACLMRTAAPPSPLRGFALPVVLPLLMAVQYPAPRVVQAYQNGPQLLVKSTDNTSSSILPKPIYNPAIS